MKNTEEKKNAISEKEMYSEGYNENYNSVKVEKNIIVVLIILTLILMWFATFFIHDIIEKGTLKDTKSVAIIENGKNDNDKKNNNDNSNNDNNNDNNNDSNNNNNNKDNNNNSNGNNNSNSDIKDPDDNIVDNNDRFKVLEGTKQWSELKELDMFSNSYFPGEKKIAPGVNGSYSFTIENYAKYTMKYDINFVEDNPYNVNMAFKLKLNGKYIAGNENTWVKSNEIDQKSVEINSMKNDIYTIEWKWKDSENDTKIGETDGAYYKMNVSVHAEQVQ